MITTKFYLRETIQGFPFLLRKDDNMKCKLMNIECEFCNAGWCKFGKNEQIAHMNKCPRLVNAPITEIQDIEVDELPKELNDNSMYTSIMMEGKTKKAIYMELIERLHKMREKEGSARFQCHKDLTEYHNARYGLLIEIIYMLEGEINER